VFDVWKFGSSNWYLIWNLNKKNKRKKEEEYLCRALETESGPSPLPSPRPTSLFFLHAAHAHCHLGPCVSPVRLTSLLSGGTRSSAESSSNPTRPPLIARHSNGHRHRRGNADSVSPDEDYKRDSRGHFLPSWLPAHLVPSPNTGRNPPLKREPRLTGAEALFRALRASPWRSGSVGVASVQSGDLDHRGFLTGGRTPPPSVIHIHTRLGVCDQTCRWVSSSCLLVCSRLIRDWG
jgi:hypothetical protein